MQLPCVVAETDTESGDVSSELHPCVVQYVIFPPHTATTKERCVEIATSCFLSTIYSCSFPLCVCVRLCVCLYPPFFRHDHLTATKFGTHVRIDWGIIRAQKNLTHPTPRGSHGGFGGSKIQKSGKCHVLSRESITNLPPPPPHPGVGGFRVTISKVREISWTAEKIDTFFLSPHPTPLVGGGSFRGQNLKVTKHKVLKSIPECNYPERLHCKYPGWSRVIQGRSGREGDMVGREGVREGREGREGRGGEGREGREGGREGGYIIVQAPKNQNWQ